MTAKYNKAQCQAAKSLNIQVSPQFGRLDYSTYTVVAAEHAVAAGGHAVAGVHQGAHPGVLR